MAASITMNSTTIEGQLLEIVRELHELEQAVPLATRPNRVSIIFDVEAESVLLTARLQTNQTGIGNQVAFSAVPYLT